MTSVPSRGQAVRLAIAAALAATFCHAALAASFVVRGADEGPSPPVLAIAALTQAPIAQVAPLFGKTAGQARDELARQGIVLDGDDKTIAQAVGRDRGKTAAALRTLAQRP